MVPPCWCRRVTRVWITSWPPHGMRTRLLAVQGHGLAEPGKQDTRAGGKERVLCAPSAGCFAGPPHVGRRQQQSFRRSGQAEALRGGAFLPKGARHASGGWVLGLARLSAHLRAAQSRDLRSFHRGGRQGVGGRTRVSRGPLALRDGRSQLAQSPPHRRRTILRHRRPRLLLADVAAWA